MIPSVEELKKTIRFKEGNRSLSRADPFAKYVLKEISPYVTWLLLHTHITANQVTLLSIFLTLVGIGFAALGVPDLRLVGLGGSLILLGHLLDCSDGEIARYRNKSTITGQFLDSLGHRIAETFTVAFITLAAYRSFPHIITVALGLASMIGVSSLSWAGRVAAVLGRLYQLPKNQTIGISKPNLGQENSGIALPAQEAEISMGLDMHPMVKIFLSFGFPINVWLLLLAAVLDCFIATPFTLLEFRLSFMYMLLVFSMTILVSNELLYGLRTVLLERPDVEYDRFVVALRAMVNNKRLDD